MGTLCYSVKLKSLVDISAKAYKAIAFDGSEAIIPKSQVFGLDFDEQRSDAYWISVWILEKKNLQFSESKMASIDERGTKQPVYRIEKHEAVKVDPLESNEIIELRR